MVKNAVAFFAAFVVAAILYTAALPAPMSATCQKNCGRCIFSCTTREGCQSPHTCLVYSCNKTAFTTPEGLWYVCSPNPDGCFDHYTDVCGFPSECNGVNQCPDPS
jgi:hypothetical protein